MRASNAFQQLMLTAKGTVAEAGAEEAIACSMRGSLLIDVRERDEWQCSSVPWAIHIPRGFLERDIERHVPAYDTQIFVACSNGERALLSSAPLRGMGYCRVRAVTAVWSSLVRVENSRARPRMPQTSANKASRAPPALTAYLCRKAAHRVVGPAVKAFVGTRHCGDAHADGTGRLVASLCHFFDS